MKLEVKMSNIQYPMSKLTVLPLGLYFIYRTDSVILSVAKDKLTLLPLGFTLYLKNGICHPERSEGQTYRYTL